MDIDGATSSRPLCGSLSPEVSARRPSGRSPRGGRSEHRVGAPLLHRSRIAGRRHGDRGRRPDGAASHPSLRTPRFGDRQAAKRHLLDVLDELVPVDEERHRESVVLLEIIAASRLNPAFAPVVRQMASDLHQVLAEAITTMGAADPAREAVRLAALISGLSLNAVTPPRIGRTGNNSSRVGSARGRTVRPPVRNRSTGRHTKPVAARPPIHAAYRPQGSRRDASCRAEAMNMTLVDLCQKLP